ncbi:MAG: hypothetical protein M1371_06205 [Actinobacteria bacterium]|nr:hypothetical protein [Actinomycetota bacterium]
MVEKIVLLLHIITAVFMAWPLYALITVNERPKLGAPLGDKVDDFMEGIIKKNSRRCFVFQTTALATGLYLTWVHTDLGFSVLITNWFILGKLLGLFVLMGLLSYVVVNLQPKIDKLFEELKKGSSKEDISKQINSLRLKRKKIATGCLFVVLTIILLAVQVEETLPLLANIVLIILIALFAYRVYRKNIPYGWI